MKYKITTNFCWFRGGSMIVKMYFINGMPFTFDELPSLMQDHPEVIAEADSHEPIEPEELWRASNYLSLEQMHPCLFELNVDNPELLPDLAQ